MRAEIHHDHCVMYLNPVVRYDGVTPPYLGRPAVKELVVQSWLARVFIGIALILGCVGWYRFVFKSGVREV